MKNCLRHPQLPNFKLITFLLMFICVNPSYGHGDHYYNDSHFEEDVWIDGVLGVGTTTPDGILDVVDEDYPFEDPLINLVHGTIYDRVSGTTTGLRFRPVVTSSCSGPGCSSYRALGVRVDFDGDGNADAIATGIDYTGGGSGTGNPGEAGLFIGDIQSSGSGSSWGIHTLIETTSDPYSKARERAAVFEIKRDVSIASGSFSRGVEIASTGTVPGGTGLLISGSGGWNYGLIVDSGAGNVGIGTNTPASQLHVSNSVGDVLIDSGKEEIRRNNGTPYLDFANDSSIDYDMRLILTGNDVLTVTGGCLSTSICSDARLKTNIKPINRTVLQQIRKLNAVSYQWKDSEDNKQYIGLIAQDIEKYFPEVVQSPTDNADGMKGLSCSGLNAITIEAIKELILENDRLKEKIQVYADTILNQDARLMLIEQKLTISPQLIATENTP